MATADILFLAAEPREFSGVLRFWQNVRPIGLPVHWARSAIRNGHPVVAIANGAGWQRARLAVDAVEHGLLCNFGYCGALDPALRIGDIVVSSRHLALNCPKPHVTGVIASVPAIVQTAEEKQRLRSEGFIAVEMEAAGLSGRPMYCIKAVSDLANETFANDLSSALLPDGRASIPRIIGGALRDPFRRFPELIRLARNASVASNQLGEFLNACNF